jgi:hypothetical protein
MPWQEPGRESKYILRRRILKSTQKWPCLRRHGEGEYETHIPYDEGREAHFRLQGGLVKGR